MTKQQAIDFIIEKLATLDDERVSALADALAEYGDVLPRQLSPRELALLEKSKDDFRNGRTVSSADVLASIRALMHDRS